MEINSDGCMRPFVKKQIWGKLKPNSKMKCPSTAKPILDLEIYTKTETSVFRDPTSKLAPVL